MWRKTGDKRSHPYGHTSADWKFAGLKMEERGPQNGNLRSHAVVRKLADELGIAPSIVLGQAQHLTKDYAWGHDLKITLKWDNREDEE